MGEMATTDRLLSGASALRGDAAPWAGSLRDGGRERFTRLGVPDRRKEAWKYSDLARALAHKAGAAPFPRAPLVLEDAFVAVFRDGVLDVAGSILPPGLTPLGAVLADPGSPFAGVLGSVNAAEQAAHPIVGLNTALMEEGFVLSLAAGEKLSAPLHVRFTWTGAASDRHVRLLVDLGEGAQATVLETHDGAPGFSTVVNEVRLAPDARLTHVRIDRLSAGARQSAVTLGEVAGGAEYRAFCLSEGAAFCRHEALVALTGESANVEIDGAFLVSGDNHCDNTTVISHLSPNTTSRQAFRGVLSGRSHSAYQGCVKVAEDAQKTDAYQMSRALLLSREARIATKPELEIFADDVKCSHGATAGEMDADALFFLRSRGIIEEEARAMLVEAFLEEALDTIAAPTLRDVAASAVRDWLANHTAEVSHGG